MPLPEIQDIYSKRFYLDYQGPAGQHTMLFRFGETAPEADCKQKIINVVTALRPQVHTTVSFVGLRYAAPGSIVSFPTTWTPIAGSSAVLPTGAQYPAFLSVVGRDTQGRRSRIFLMGVSSMPDTDYRVLRAEAAPVATILDAIQSALPTPLVSKGGFVVIWNDYVNFGYHAYFQRKRRVVA